MATNYRLWEYKLISALNNQDSIDQFDQTDTDVTSFGFSTDRIIGNGSGKYIHANNTSSGYIWLFKVPLLDITNYDHTFVWIKQSQVNSIQIVYAEAPANFFIMTVPTSYYPTANKWYMINAPHSLGGGSYDPTKIKEVGIKSDAANLEMLINFWCIAKQTEFEFAEATLENPPPDSLRVDRSTEIASNRILGGSGNISTLLGHGSREFIITAKLFGKTDSTNANPHDKLHLQNQLYQLVLNQQPLLLEWDKMFFPVVITDFPSIIERQGEPLIWDTSIRFMEYNNDR